MKENTKGAIVNECATRLMHSVLRLFHSWLSKTKKKKKKKKKKTLFKRNAHIHIFLARPVLPELLVMFDKLKGLWKRTEPAYAGPSFASSARTIGLNNLIKGSSVYHRNDYLKLSYSWSILTLTAVCQYVKVPFTTAADDILIKKNLRKCFTSYWNRLPFNVFIFREH